MDDNSSSGADRIAFQGTFGAFSHLACIEFAPSFAPLPCETFFDAFDAVSRGRAALALIPVENLIAGRVADVHQLLPEIDLRAVGEHYQPVRFELLGIPGATLDDINVVTSHVHALAQCRKLIQKLGAQTYISIDTAQAAKTLLEDGQKSRAVLASSLAAELYGLDILQADVADVPQNCTRFLAFSLAPQHYGEPLADAPFVTSLIAQTKNIPSALYRLLGVFAINGINITRLESCLSGANFERSSFHIDFEHIGHIVDDVLTESSPYTEAIRVIGTYPAAQFRLSKKTAMRDTIASVGSAERAGSYRAGHSAPR